MKKHSSKKSVWQSLWSLGVYKMTVYHSKDRSEINTGKRDEFGRWQGPVKITVSEEKATFYEEANMINGLRHGESKITGYSSLGVIHDRDICYHMG